METPTHADLETVDEVLQFLGLAVGIGHLIFKELQVPDLTIHLTLRTVLNPVARSSLSQCPDHDTLRLNNRLQG